MCMCLEPYMEKWDLNENVVKTAAFVVLVDPYMDPPYTIEIF